MATPETFSIEEGDGNEESNENGCKLKNSYTIRTRALKIAAGIFICFLVLQGLTIYNFPICLKGSSEGPNSSNEWYIDLNDSILNKNNGSSKHSDNNHSITETHLLPPRLLAIKQLDKQQENDPNLRLPRSIIPIRYNISLIPHLRNSSFNGMIWMTIKVIENCNNVTFHLANIEVERKNIIIRRLKPSKKVLQISSLNYVVKKQFFEIYLKDQLKKGYLCEIYIPYKGVLSNDFRGFYRRSYMGGKQLRFFAATQFQPTYARRAFPCFDEPAFKAKFTINIARFKEMNSISNMPQIRNGHPEVKNLPSYVWDNYEESVPMSTYSVAFAVSDFSNLSNENKNFTVWARSDVLQYAKYALTVGPKILKFFEKFFRVEFPLPKIDMIAVPDFQAEAMENWGLITYREDELLYDAKTSTVINKFRVALVVAHKLAHQWFGNLVTPSWWSDIWLNEGLATYLEYKAVDAVEPSWRSMDHFVITKVQNVFILDALTSSQKTSVEVTNPDEVNEIFDQNTYARSAAIIRMIYYILTAWPFQGGFKDFLTELAFKSAEPNELWRHLTIAGGLRLNDEISVNEIVDLYTLQSGYPVVTVQTDTRKKLMVFRQDTFSFVANNKTDDKLLWWVPLSDTCLPEPEFRNVLPTFFLRKTRTYSTETRDYCFKSYYDWYIVNIKTTGYYRVNYDLKNWHKLITYLRDNKGLREISPITRAQLIDDAFNLARAGMLDYHLALNLSLYLRNEDDYIPWKTALQTFNFFDAMFIKDGEYFYFKEYFLKIMTGIFLKFELKDIKEKDLLKTFLHSEILTTVCYLGNNACISKYVKQFRTWMQARNPETQNPISPDLRSFVYCLGVQYGGNAEFAFVYNRFVRTKILTEKEILLSGLACSRKEWLLNYAFKLALRNKEIQKKDVLRIFETASRNPIGQTTAFSFLWNNWDEIKKRFDSSLLKLNELIKYTAIRMNNRFELDELKNFIEKHHRNGGRSIDQVVEQIEVNIEWREKYFDHIVKWLKKNT